MLAGVKGMMYNSFFGGRCSMITTFYLPIKVIFGAGSLKQLGMEARELGQKAMLVTGHSSMRRTGVVDRVVQDLKSNGMNTLVFDKEVSNG